MAIGVGKSHPRAGSTNRVAYPAKPFFIGKALPISPKAVMTDQTVKPTQQKDMNKDAGPPVKFVSTKMKLSPGV